MYQKNHEEYKMKEQVLTLVLIRHATTDANEAGLYIGRSESPLSLKGREEAKRICKRLEEWRFNNIYISPSERAKETILPLIEQNQPVEIIEALQEIDFGMCEARHFNWLLQHHPEEVVRMQEEGMMYQYPGGESLLMAHQRVANWLNEFLKSHQSGTYLVVAHGGTIRCIVSELLVKNPSLHWHFKINPATLTVIHIQQGFPVIDVLNEKC